MALKKVNSKIPSSKLGVIISALLICVCSTYGQPSLPVRNINVNAIQSLNFGTFVLMGGTGGSVLMGYDGIRTATPGIILLGSAPYGQPAIFEVQLLQGRNVRIDFSPTAILTNSDGGTLMLNIGPTEKGINGAYFPTSNNREFKTLLRVGGKLDIPGTAIPGTYSGTFFITFNQE